MASSATNASAGIMDLERELSCSICTDLLYQPLTCIPCLHTFCGSCLKEWFGWQAVRHDQQHARGSARRRARPEFTCPSCRAAVRETRPNATVTTLLDMYTAANPGKGKSADEKQEIDRNYKHGDAVLPAEVHVEDTDTAEEVEDVEDAALLEEVRQLSLSDAHMTNGTANGRDFRARVRLRHDQHDRRGHSRRRDHSSNHARTPQAQLGVPVTDRQRSSSRRRQEAERRQLEHQSSLRSLLSNSEGESEEMQAEILRQITEEGLLDGIDLDNIRVEQEDEISERIAQAYRRRQREMAMQRESNRRAARRDLSVPDTDRSRNRPSHQRMASHGSAPAPAAEAVSRPRRGTDTQRSERPGQAAAGREHGPQPQASARVSQETRRGAEPARRAIIEQWRQGAVGISPQPPAMSILPDDESNRPTSSAVSARAQQEDSAPSSSPAPTVSCDRCGLQHIEFELHYNCHKCSSTTTSTYDLCRSCFLLGRGCLHWFGFGYAAEARFQRQAPPGGWPQGTEPPHVLQARCYTKPANRDLSRPDQAVTLQSGLFCDNCFQNANECYWRCDRCNEGDWGFCNACIGQSRHCTHPLLALAMIQQDDMVSQSLVTLQPTTFCNLCSQAIDVSKSRYHCPICNEGDFDICHSCYNSLVANGQISTSDGPQGQRLCPSGHHMLVAAFECDEMGYNRRIVSEPVVGGWASRPEARDGAITTVHGQRLIDDNSGWVCDERNEDGVMNRRTVSSTSKWGIQRLANGGWGKKMVTLWTRVPAKEAKDELTFPKYAEITEVIDINGDWCSGVYCGRLGLFPGPFARPSS